MNGWIKGMGSFNLFPRPAKTDVSSAWLAVGEAFRATGENMWQAMNELPIAPYQKNEKSGAAYR